MTDVSKPGMRVKELVLHARSRVLDVTFANGQHFSFSFEFLRVNSPSAEVLGHGPGQEVLQTNKRDVDIKQLEPVGNYGVKPVFDDGHETGIFSWDYLLHLGQNQERLWGEYLAKLDAAGASRDPLPQMRSIPSSVFRNTFGLCESNMTEPETHFGYQRVAEADKSARVAGVFDSVSKNYDVMNDLMSLGMHRLWKAFTIGRANVRPGQKVLDIAGGTGDLASAFARSAGPLGEVWLTDINQSMLSVGRDKLIDRGVMLPMALCDAEALPFADHHFDLVTVAFGLRNMTHKEQALREMTRVLKPGGRLMVLEFSKVWKPLQPVYDAYSFRVLPWLGKRVADDADSYRYLAESIRMHPDQHTLKTMMADAGLSQVKVFNLAMGVVALHEGAKL